MNNRRRTHARVHRISSRGAVIALLAALIPAAALATFSLSDGSSDPSPAGDGTEVLVRGSAASDEACPRPYSDASPWNTPIGAQPTYHQRSAQFVARIRGPLTSDPTQYSYPVYPVTADTPMQTVQVSGVFSDVTNDRALEIQRAGTVRLPIPEGATAAAGSDAQIILVNQATGDEWGAWRLRRSDSGWKITNGYHYNIRWSGVPPRAPNGRPFGSRGAGVPYLAGLVRPCELSRGRIEHALAFAYDAPAPSHVYPATKSDGAGVEGLDVPEGTRLQLDPTLSVAQIKAYGCEGPCLTIARALQEYGMYTIDNSGRSKVMLEYETTARWNGLVNAKTVSAIPISAFKVIKDPRPQSVPAKSEGCTIVGTPRADRLSGTPGDDVICGRGGDDRLSGGKGDDRLIGGRGNDKLSGGPGKDRLLGQAGRDRLRGGPGRDRLSGGADHDVLLSRDGQRDRLEGGPGSDVATVDRALDVLSSIYRVRR